MKHLSPYDTLMARLHRESALAVTLRNGYMTHSLCSVSIAANALCEYSLVSVQTPMYSTRAFLEKKTDWSGVSQKDVTSHHVTDVTSRHRHQWSL